MNLKMMLLAACVLACALPAGLASAQMSQMEAAASDLAETDQEETAATDEPHALRYSDYSVKSYSLSFLGGQFSGATYLDLKPLGDRTILTEGAGDIMGYDGNVLIESRDTRHYTAPIKEIEAGSSFGGRLGIYISDDFHLDLTALYAQGKAVTSMLYTRDREDLETYPWQRVTVDTDDGFRVYKGGLALMYDAEPATMFGLTPKLGFGLGGVINRFSELEDKTALYLEGNFGLDYQLFDNFELGARYDVTVFAFEVDELGYSNMVTYNTISLGAVWHIDVLPSDVRAAHEAERREKRK